MAPKLLTVRMFPKVTVFGKDLQKALEEAAEAPLHEAAKLVRDEAKESIKDEPPQEIVKVQGTTPTGGRFVRLRRRPVKSQPGGPPFSRTGNLRNNIVAIKNFVGVTRAAFYGRFVEFGTRRAAARPFLRPALERMRPFIAPLLKDMNLAQTRAGRRMNRRKAA